MSLTTDMLHELLYYKDGKLFWKVARGRIKADSEAGTLHSSGYLVVAINNKKHLLHRLVYLLHNGHIPNRLEIDHIDGNRMNNKIENLRAVTKTVNQQNRRSAKGYTWIQRDSKWQVVISVDGKSKYIGRYNTEEEARKAYLKAKQEYHQSTPNDYFA